MNITSRFKYLLAFALFWGVAEYLIYTSSFSIVGKLYFHIFISAICLITLFSLWPFRYKEDLRFIILLSILLAFMGPVGAFLTVLTIFLYFLYRGRADDAKELIAGIFPEHKIPLSYYYYDRIIHGLDDFNPGASTCEFLDIMRFGTSRQKRLALEKIIRHFKPQFADSLRYALKDSDNQIRILAATAITALNQMFFKKYLKLEERCAFNARRRDILKFAIHCDRYFSSGLLDDERKELIVEKAIGAYEKYFSLDSSHDGVWAALLKLYISSGQSKKAIAIFESYSKREDIPPKIKMMYLKALYEEGRLADLRAFIAKNEDLLSAKKNSEFVKIAHWWGGGV